MNGLKEFVVIDVETTGVLRNCDRIIEIGMIRVKGEEIISELNTLICPNRDLGPTNIHRITAAQVADAPRFDEIAGDVVELLRGAVVVAHNAHFDVGMLGSEFERLGLEIGDLPMICTMGLAYEFGPSSRRLESCCEHFGIHITNAHAAYSDAQATLHLFKCYLQVMKERSTDLQAVRAYRAGSHRTLPYVKPSGRRWLRSDCSSLVRADYIASLIERLPETGSADTARYYGVLDRALEDRRITATEAQELTTVALESGLSPADAMQANEDYLSNLVQVALADGKISTAERIDLETVAALLGFDKAVLDKMITKSKLAPQSPLPTTLPYVGGQLSGSTVCFTGTLMSKRNGTLITRDEAEQLARAAGLIPVSGVTKKTQILVIADPDSMSGKAKKAREYGTRIMAESVFWNAIGVQVE